MRDRVWKLVRLTCCRAVQTRADLAIITMSAQLHSNLEWTWEDSTVAFGRAAAR